MAQKVRSCGIITLGAVIYALAFDWFVAPNQIAMGGVTGLAQIVNALVPVLPVGVLSILVNVPLFLAGWRLLGGRLLVSSLYAMAVSSLAIDVIAWMHTFPPMDPILATLYGGAGMGVGLGLVFSQGATTGGTDIIGKLLKLKFPWLPIGKLVMIPDMVVVILAAVVFGTVNAALYGLIQMYLLSKVMDMILYGWDTSRVAYIITDRWEETVQGLLDMNRGVTLLQGKGAYTGAEKQVLLVAFRQREIVLEALLHEDAEFTFGRLMEAENVAYATAYADLSQLKDLGFLQSSTCGKTTVFTAVDDLSNRLNERLQRMVPDAWAEMYEPDGTLRSTHRTARDEAFRKLKASIPLEDAILAFKSPVYQPDRVSTLLNVSLD